MVNTVEKMWNSLRKYMVKTSGIFCTDFRNSVFKNSFWWICCRFSHILQKFCAKFLFKNTPIFCDKLGGFTHFPHSLLLLLN